MQRFLPIFRRQRGGHGARDVSGRGARRRRSWAGRMEALERRAMLAVTVTPNAGGNELYILYNQTGADSVVTTANQNVIIEVEDIFFPVTQTRVNVYVPSNPLVINPPPLAPVQTYVFFGIEHIYVDVPNFDLPGVNNNTLTIKGILEQPDRIIVAGSGRTASARWSDETADELQVLFDIEGIDDLTVTAGGVINVSGVFSNDTADASIKVVATIPEEESAQLTGTVVVGEATPVGGILPHPRLESNFIEIAGAELDILADIVATDHVILRAGENAPEGSRAHLVLPYDVTVTGNPTTATSGVLELYSTKNIEQFPGSTLTAGRLVAASNNANVATLAGPWMINLGSEANDFDSISLGMTAAPGDAAVAATEGRIGVRDIDDLTVADFGILASTGVVRLDVGGALTIAAPVQATGLILESDDSVVSTAGAVMRIGDRGVSILANAGAVTSTGNVTLAGPITIQDDAPATLVTNTITGDGIVTLAGGLFCPQAGTTTVAGRGGVVLSSPVQVGASKLDAEGKAVTIFSHNLNLTSAAAGIDVGPVPGNDSTPFAVQATNIIALNAPDTITIAGSVFAGTIFGDPAALTKTQALPSITIRGLANVDITATGSLRTQAFQNDPAVMTNPLLGKITIRDASQIDAAGPITADGAVDIGIVGDVQLAAVTARENVVVRTTTGSISLQGPTQSTGATYAVAPTPGSQREPNVILDAPLGAIATSGLGTITAGVANATVFGKVLLTAQQDVSLGADIVTPGIVTVTSKLGLVAMSALVQADNKSAVTLTAGNGILQSDLDLARMVTASLTLLNTGAAGGASDIDLRAKNNQIGTVVATNLAVGGAIRIANNAALTVGSITAAQSPVTPSVIALTSSAGITQTGPIVANQLIVTGTSAAAITLPNVANDVDQFAANNPRGGVTFADADGFETGVLRPPAPAPLTVEVIADALVLSSAAPFSTVRVVSGLQYRTLNISAATAVAATVGKVEYVTTSTVDNPPPNVGGVPVFAGTLRDMIRYANDNLATYIVSGSPQPQPQAMVFDEDGYDVGTITVGAVALPGFTKPVTFDGGRLTPAILALNPAARLGLTAVAGTNAMTGLRFDLGSGRSLITRLSVGGFTRGSGIQLSSGGSTVTDVWAGVAPDESPRPNWAGIDVTGAGATGNIIGSAIVDEPTRNLFSRNGVGVLVRNGASGTLVIGNRITRNGTSTTQGDGIRINGAFNTSIGTPDAFQADLSPSVSNEITNNEGAGVRIVTSNAGTLNTANRIRNNFISGNRGLAGVAVSGSQFAVIGGIGRGGNTIVAQTGAGIDISTSANIRVLGNDIGLDDREANALPAGNLGHGVVVSGSRQVGITAENRIASNTLNGILITNASTGVNVTGNTIGLPGAGNLLNGVAISSSIGNAIGAGNVISSNSRNGVSIENARATSLAAGNRVFGSLVESNGESGISVSGGSFSWLGGTKVGEANLIQSNAGSGITVQWNAVTGSPASVTIEGNLVGTTADREVTPLGNGNAGIRLVGATNTVVAGSNAVMNNTGAGVVVEGGSGNMIGGSAAGRGNEISANDGHGVVVRAATLAGLPIPLRSARSVTVMGNAIADNTGNGVLVTGSVSGPSVAGATIGQSVSTGGTSGVGNVIQGNGGFGIDVAAGAQQVGFQGNSIADNLGGAVRVAPGANRSTAQSLSLSSAVLRGAGASQSVTITGTLRNPVFGQQQYSIDFYANSPGDGTYSSLTGYQARRFIGRATVVANASGTATFTLRITAPLEVGDVITAMATSLRFEAGSTSLLSNGVTADLPGIPTPRF